MHGHAKQIEWPRSPGCPTVATFVGECEPMPDLQEIAGILLRGSLSGPAAPMACELQEMSAQL